MHAGSCIGNAKMVSLKSREIIKIHVFLSIILPFYDTPSYHLASLLYSFQFLFTTNKMSPFMFIPQWRPGSARIELGFAEGGSTKGSDGGTQNESNVDPSEAIKELLAACPITEVQRTRFVDAVTINNKVAMPAKGKPSDEVVALLQAKRIQKDEVHCAHKFSECTLISLQNERIHQVSSKGCA